MREERQWLMASGDFVPDELKMNFSKEDENKDSDTERRPASTRNKTTMEGGDMGLEERDEDLYTGMFKGIYLVICCKLMFSVQMTFVIIEKMNDDCLEQL